MPEPNNESIEDLEKEKLRAETLKLDAEASKTKAEQRDIEKRHKQRRWDLLSKAVAVGLVAGPLLLWGLHTAIPLLQIESQRADALEKYANMRLRMAADSAKAAEMKIEQANSLWAAAEDSLTQVRETREKLVSLERQFAGLTGQLKSSDSALEEERANAQEEIRKLESRISDLQDRLQLAEAEGKIRPEDSRLWTASGYVLIHGSQSQRIEGVVVTDRESGRADTTDSSGNFTLSFPEHTREVTLWFRKAGYRVRSETFRPDGFERPVPLTMDSTSEKGGN